MNKLKKNINNQLQALENKIENLRNWQIETEEELWDSDYYWDLLNELKETINLLESDEGLLENLETWQNNNEDDEDNE